MFHVAWKMLAHKAVRLWATWAGLGVLFFLSAAQLGLLVGWCNSCSAIIRNAAADIWVMAEQTQAFDYGTPIPDQRIYQSRCVEGVENAVGMIMAWNTWQRQDGKRINIELVGLDDPSVGGPWKMQNGVTDCVQVPDSVIVDELFLGMLGVQRLGDEAELYGRRAVVRGISSEIRTLTASPFIFTSLDSARKFDRRYEGNEITYVLVRCKQGESVVSVRDRLRKELPHVEVLTKGEFGARTMQYWMLETGLGITVVLTSLLGLIVSVVVTSQTLFAVTQDYIKNYGTLSAIGFSRYQLSLCVVTQGLVLVTGGVFLGSTLFALAARMSARTPLPLETFPEIYIALILTFVFSSLIGAFLSLLSILRLEPASVFRG